MTEIWQLRYKDGLRPVESTHIKADGRDEAEEIGRAWCASKGDGLRPVKFVNVQPFISADAAILGKTIPIPVASLPKTIRQ